MALPWGVPADVSSAENDPVRERTELAAQLGVESGTRIEVWWRAHYAFLLRHICLCCLRAAACV